jgi:hypothetical protein
MYIKILRHGKRKNKYIKLSKFCQSLRQYLVKKYLLDWQRSNDMLKDGKLVTYLFLKTNFGLEKYLTLVNNFNRPLTYHLSAANQVNIFLQDTVVVIDKIYSCILEY